MSMTLLERWRRRWRAPAPLPVADVEAAAPGLSTPPVAAPEVIDLDIEAMMRQSFPDHYAVAATAAEQVIGALADADLSPLARRSPSLAGYDWPNYLRCSICRVIRVQAALRAYVPVGGRVLDYGSYFGNFALAARLMGYAVDAIDSYRGYSGALDPWVRLQRDAGISVHDFADTGYDLREAEPGTFDAVICAGVLEHMPHTPRPLLETLNGSLRQGGVMILDTPNLGYLYKRLALLNGSSIFAPIEQQYFTEIPFEGHHREYTIDEVRWLVDAAGHEQVSIETFNYSMFGARQLTGEHADYFRAMEIDPSLRELILSVSRRR